MNDKKSALFIAIFALLYTVPFLGSLEFLRHTEADRALIAWEMLERGDFVIPHLLGDVYLTKPPFFYNLITASFWLTGTTSEWAARLPSAMAFSLLLVAHYIFLRAVGWGGRHSLTGTIVLGTMPALFLPSISAEIDMVFTALNTAAVYCCYLGFKNGSAKALFASNAFLALALLTKGPTAFLFITCSTLGCIILFGRRLVPVQIAGLTLALLPTAAWAYVVIERLGAEHLNFRFNEQIVERFLNNPGKHQRSILYYLGALSAGSLPWLAGVIGLIKKRSDLKKDKLLIYCLYTILPSLFVLSIASGKAHRYALPLYPFLAIILSVGILKLWDLKSKFIKALSLTILLFFVVRYTALPIYAHNRNSKLSPKAAAVKISEQTTAPIYILNLSQRWLVFYLKHLGMTVKRLTPSLALELRKNVESVYLLFDPAEEGKSIVPIQEYIEESSIFKVGKNDLRVIKLPGKALQKLKIGRYFRTVPLSSKSVRPLP